MTRSGRLNPGALLALMVLAANLGAPSIARESRAKELGGPIPGESIYLNGMLPSGQLLHGSRQAMQIEGRNAACVSCHRRSGLGAQEGLSTIPPITGQFLFHAGTIGVDDSDLPWLESYRGNRDPYTEQTLARAIREGIGVDGRSLSVLMPHYDLSDADMATLIAYLKSLNKGTVPGVTESTLHFATIITPDADPIKKTGMLEVLQKYFVDKNAAARGVAPRLKSSRQMRFRAVRRWELHVWELTGSPSTWQAQLHEKLEREPVFAVMSGLGGKTWAPVHRFCQQERIPCLFPNVELPVAADDAFYSLYFSKSVLLDAALIGHDLQARASQNQPARVVQVYRSEDVGEEAAKTVGAVAASLGVPTVQRRLNARAAPGDLKRALDESGEGDALVLWLRPNDIEKLVEIKPRAAVVWMSGVMGNLESAPVPPAWRPVTHLAYAFDLPDFRRVRLDYPLGWFRLRKIPVIALPVQADTYLACGLVSETLNRMADTFVRDYLIERIEGMVEHRIITGYYPRLSLAQGQRFASKGGYLVHFTGPSGNKIAADGAWVTP
jgi:Cytochrome c